jgi:hypothetical protein
VGIAKTGKYRSLTESDRCFFYIPYPQWPFSDTVALCLRTRRREDRIDAVRDDIDPIEGNTDQLRDLPPAELRNRDDPRRSP